MLDSIPDCCIIIYILSMGQSMIKDQTVRIIKNATEPGTCDIIFWMNKTAEERIAAIEEMRKDYWGENYASEQRFPRFYKITKHTQC